LPRRKEAAIHYELGRLVLDEGVRRRVGLVVLFDLLKSTVEVLPNIKLCIGIGLLLAGQKVDLISLLPLVTAAYLDLSCNSRYTSMALDWMASTNTLTLWSFITVFFG
jgi:hypothetical protein